MANGSDGDAAASRPLEPWPPAPLAWPAHPLSDGVVALDPMTHEDVPRLAAGAADGQVQRWLSLPSPYTEASARQFLAEQAEAAAAGRELAFAVRRAGQPELCGSMALCLTGRRGEGEIGYWISPDVRGRGLASAGIRVLARWAVATLALHRVEMLVEPSNTASQRACQRAGAAPEGLRRRGLALPGRPVTDALVYSLVPDDLAAG